MQIDIRVVFFTIVISIKLGTSDTGCELPFLKNGVANIQKQDGSIQVHLECNPPYSLIGNPISKCENGKWDEQERFCAMAGCTKPKVENAEVTIDEGHTVTVKCADGHILAGQWRAYCNGTFWDRPLGKCLESRCPILDVENSIVGHNIDSCIIVECKPGYTLAGNWRAFCKGTNWDRPLGKCMDIKSIPVSCDFETDMCGWTNDDWLQDQWIRLSSTNESRSRGGPNRDHTTMQTNGHFLLVEWDRSILATVMSPVYPAELSKNACFQFWYHTYGDGARSFYVFVKPESNASYILPDKHLIKVKDVDGNEWKMGSLAVPALTENFRIVIKAVGGRINNDGIAIDDVKLMRGNECS